MRAATDRPNIILINCDDLGYGDLGCYGSEANKTPAIDRLAEEGLLLTDYYAGSPVCSPSRASLMTGCYPPRNGMDSYDGHWVLFPGFETGLNPNEVTIAQLLKGRGYATKLIGKWHLGDQPEFLPTRFGFDDYYGIPYSNDMGRQKNHHSHPPLPLLHGEQVLEEQPDQAGLTARYVEHAVEFVRENRESPFFLYFAHMYVHLPIYPPARFLSESENGAYGAAVACIDWALAVVMDELKRQGLDENTLVIFTSDNGCRCTHGGSNGKLRGKKGTTWEGGMRVPCIVRWAGQIAPGQQSPGMASMMDWLPTLAGLADAPVPDDRVIDGMDLAGFLAEPASGSPRDEMLYYRQHELQAIRAGKWKYHALTGELYDLEADLGELTNVAAENAETVAQLEARLSEVRVDLGDSAKEVEGAGRRPVGRVENARPLTEFDPAHPYYAAEYDLEDVG